MIKSTDIKKIPVLCPNCKKSLLYTFPHTPCSDYPDITEWYVECCGPETECNYIYDDVFISHDAARDSILKLFPSKKKRVFHFSGGHSSAWMVLHYWKPGDLVIFCDTGREDIDTYRFVIDFEEVNQIPVIWLTGDFRKDVIIKESMIPNRFKRKCTINLKIKKARRFLRSIGWYSYTQFIGFRADEKERVQKYKHQWQAVQTIFPIYDERVTKPEINLFWLSKPYRLKIPPILGNCDLCFQKGKNAIIAILQQFPEKADRWIEDEENKAINPKGYTYFPGTTIRQLRAAAEALERKFDLFDISPEFNCSCTS